MLLQDVLFYSCQCVTALASLTLLSLHLTIGSGNPLVIRPDLVRGLDNCNLLCVFLQIIRHLSGCAPLIPKFWVVSVRVYVECLHYNSRNWEDCSTSIRTLLGIPLVYVHLDPRF